MGALGKQRRKSLIFVAVCLLIGIAVSVGLGVGYELAANGSQCASWTGGECVDGEYRNAHFSCQACCAGNPAVFEVLFQQGGGNTCIAASGLDGVKFGSTKDTGDLSGKSVFAAGGCPSYANASSAPEGIRSKSFEVVGEAKDSNSSSERSWFVRCAPADDASCHPPGTEVDDACCWVVKPLRQQSPGSIRFLSPAADHFPASVVCVHVDFVLYFLVHGQEGRLRSLSLGE
jgi:hypothetical protein